MIKPGVWVEDPFAPDDTSEEIQERLRTGDTEGARELVKEQLRECLEPFRGGFLTEEAIYRVKAAAKASIQRMVAIGYMDSYEIHTTDLDPTLLTRAAVAKRDEQVHPSYYFVAYLDSPYLPGKTPQIVIEVSA